MAVLLQQVQILFVLDPTSTQHTVPDLHMPPCKIHVQKSVSQAYEETAGESQEVEQGLAFNGRQGWTVRALVWYTCRWCQPSMHLCCTQPTP